VTDTTFRTFQSADRIADLVQRFRAQFDGVPRVYRAPGRVNHIGEHTHYNEGFVLPVALGLSCWVAAAPRHDKRIVVHSEDVGDQFEWDLAEADAAPTHAWSDYVRGVTLMLQRTIGDREVRGASLLVRSDVPIGAGLSSSAAIEVAVAKALVDTSGVPMEPIEIAKLCQRAENEFVGARCGIMDQFIACHARPGHALLLDCRSLESRAVPLPSRVRLVACNTMVRHSIAGGEYNRRRAECEEGVAGLAARMPGVHSLRDVDLAALEREGGGLRDVIRKRCRHVVSENARVLRAAEALDRNDLDAVGAQMADSHRSLRDDYEVSCAELDAMVEIASESAGVHGARMTGGGFGGCTVNLVDRDAVNDFRRHVASRYKAKTGRWPDIYVTEAGGGAERVA
jgi:galactokinase